MQGSGEAQLRELDADILSELVEVDALVVGRVLLLQSVPDLPGVGSLEHVFGRQ